MLISFTVGNFRSFAEPQTLSMVAAKDDAHPEHVVDCGTFGLLRAAALYGANASGKSNLVKAFRVVKSLVTNSATLMTLGDVIPAADPFRLDKLSVTKPSSFEVRLLLGGTEYQYGFSVTSDRSQYGTPATMDRVHDEWLFVKRAGTKLSRPLMRHFNSETGKTEWTLRGELRGAKDITDKTRDNGLFLSRAAEMNVEFVKELFLWFQSGILQFDLADPLGPPMFETARRVGEDPEFRIRVEGLVHDADLGIEGLSVERTAERLESRDAEEAANDVARYLLFSSLRRISFDVQTHHRLTDSEERVRFSLQDDESNGTQRFFALIGPVLDALDVGNLLVVDELECSMHPLLTRKVVELFQNPEANPKGAQLVFATHDSTLMSPALLRRDQIWLMEKNSKSATEMFSLCEIEREKRPRKEEAFGKNYLAGRYGGVPSFGPALEDAEVR